MITLIFNENTTNIFINSVLFSVYIFITFCGIYVITSKNPILSVLYLILLFSVVACYLIQLTASFIGLAYILVYVGAVSILFLFILMLINVRVSELVTDNYNSIVLSIFVISIFTIVLDLSVMWSSENKIICIEKENEIVSNIKGDTIKDKDISENSVNIYDTNVFYKNEMFVETHNTDHFDLNKDIHDLTNSIEKINGILSEKKDPFTALYKLLSELFKSSYNNIFSGKTSYDVYSVTGYTWDTVVTYSSHISSIGNIIYMSYPTLLFVISMILLLSMVGSIIITVKR